MLESRSHSLPLGEGTRLTLNNAVPQWRLTHLHSLKKTHEALIELYRHTSYASFRQRLYEGVPLFGSRYMHLTA